MSIHMGVWLKLTLVKLAFTSQMLYYKGKKAYLRIHLKGLTGITDINEI